MSPGTKQTLKSVFFSVALVTAVALAAPLTLPFNFTAGTPARAAEVNSNFGAVKAAVDGQDTRLTVVEAVHAGTWVAPSLQTNWTAAGTTKCRRIGDTVSLVFQLSTNPAVAWSVTPASSSHAFVLPAECRPATVVAGLASFELGSGAGMTIGEVYIATNGDVFMLCPPASATCGNTPGSSKTVTGTLTFPAL